MIELMKTRLSRCVWIALGMLPITPMANGEVLALYGGSNFISEDINVDSTASLITSTESLQFISGTSGPGASAYFMNSSFTGDNPTEEYCGFTITPDPGKSLVLDSVEFLLGISMANNLSFNTTISVAWSVDGFSQTLGSDSLSASLSGIVFRPVKTIGLGSMVISDPVEFRFYVADDRNFNSHATVLDSVRLNGSVVPEPRAAAIVVAAALVTFTRRRRLD